MLVNPGGTFSNSGTVSLQGGLTSSAGDCENGSLAVGLADVGAPEPKSVNTPEGTNVSVQPLDPTTGTAPATLIFSFVSQAGTTSLTTGSSGPPPPSGFQVGDPSIYYDLTTTALFSDPVGGCIDYSGVSFIDESNLALFHFENGAWVDVTSSLNTVDNIICGSVTSLSPFAIFESVNHPPVAKVGPDQRVECVGPTGIMVTLDGTGSSDPDGDPLTFTWTGPFGTAVGATPSVSLPPGIHTITLTLDDGNGGTDTDTVVITLVEDTTPPMVAVSASPTSLWPPNHKYEGIPLTVAASDICDASPTVSAKVISDEADAGKGDGKTTGDIKVTTAGGDVLLSSNAAPQVAFDPVNDQLELRAERSGSGDGRVYTIHVTAEDASGNTASSTAMVTVEHDKGKKSAKVVAAHSRVGMGNHPNPFNPSTTIRYTLPEAAAVRLSIYSILGQRVQVLVDATQGAGVHAVEWDGRDVFGHKVAAGVYLYRLETGPYVEVRKMVFTK